MGDRNQVMNRGRGSVATSGPVKVEARLEELRSILLSKADQITVALAETIPAERFIELALTAIATANNDARDGQKSTRDKLLECSASSLVTALVQCAQTGLRIDGRQSTLIPYKGEAQWTPMVKGRIDLILRAPNVAKVVARHVLDCDRFYFELGTDERIEHVPELDPPKDAKLTHAYAVVTYRDGTKAFEVLPESRIEQIRTQFSKAPDSPAWKKSKNEMAQKCALNRIERWVDTDPEHSRRMAIAMAAEFAIGARDMKGDIADRVRDQVAEARAKVMALKPGAEPVPPPEETPEQRIERRRALLDGIKEEAKRCDLSPDEAAGEARGALFLAGIDGYPTTEDDAPNLVELGPDELGVILAHYKTLTEGAQGATEGDGARAATSGPKVRPVTCWKASKGFVHVREGDAHPGRCLGCSVSLEGATAVEASADATVYCPKGLRAAAELPDNRLPDALIEAAKGGA